MTHRKHSTSQLESTHSTGEFKSVCEFPENFPEDPTLGDMVNEKQELCVTSKQAKRKNIRKTSSQKKWSQEEVKRLHKCVEIFGIDFTLIGKIITNRTRSQLMSKFRKEDKLNRQKVDNSLKANKRMRLSKYVKRQKNLRKQSLVSVNSLDSTDINLVNEVRKMIVEDERELV